jgi:hypothetical protein
MRFVQSGMLAALAALAIPVVIHLLFRNRPRTVELGTLQFLQAVLRENARKRKMKRWVLLALRLACVALIALLFARPYLLATEPGAGDRLVVVLVDRSASMDLKGAPTPFARAIEGARAVLSRAGAKSQVEAATFDRAVHPLREPRDLGRAPLATSAAGTDYAAAMAWARDLCTRSPRPVKEVHVFTDLQRSGLDRGETVALPPGVDVRLVDLGRAFPKNVAVTALAASPDTVRPGAEATITAAVRNTSPLPLAAIPVRLHLESGGAARDLEKTVDLDGGATVSLAFELKDLPEGLWRGHVEATADADELAFDDRRYLALAVEPPTTVLLLDGDQGKAPFGSETYFLQAALRLAPEGERYEKTPFDPKVIDASEPDRLALPELNGVGAVVLANVGGLGEPEARRLAAFVEGGGGLLVFTGDRVGPESLRALERAGLGVGAVLGPAPAEDLPWRLERWQADHPVFRPFANPEHGDLRRPAFATITRIKLHPSARVLATFRGGEPALLERAHGRGKVLWFASACDRDWGDWPRGRLYVPLVHQMVADVTGLADGGRVRQLAAGDGREPGIVGSEADRVVRVVNADPFESDTARCTPSDFARRFGFPPPGPSAVAAPDRAGPGRPARPDERLRNDEVWPWFAAALLGMLFLEQFLANRTAA